MVNRRIGAPGDNDPHFYCEEPVLGVNMAAIGGDIFITVCIYKVYSITCRAVLLSPLKLAVNSPVGSCLGQ